MNNDIDFIESRRRLIQLAGVAAIALSAASVEGCSIFQNVDISVPTVAAVVEVMGSLGQQTLLALQSLSPRPAWLTPDLVNNVMSINAGIQQVAASISSVSTIAGAQPIIQQLETYVSALINALAGLPLPPPISLYVQIAAVVMPILFAILNMAIPPQAQTQAQAARLSVHKP
jgi:hypothetical protein